MEENNTVKNKDKKEEILKEIGNNYNEYLNVIKNITKLQRKEQQEDILHQIIDYILTDFYPINLLFESHQNNKLKYYLIYLIKQEYYSKTSKLFRDTKRYGQNHSTIQFSPTIEDQNVKNFENNDYNIKLHREIESILNENLMNKKLHWYEVELFKTYYDDPDMTYSDLCLQTKIVRSQCYLSVTKVKNIVSKELFNKIDTI